MKRELPIYNIEGTDFIVDVANLQLREKGSENVIPVLDMRDIEDGYEFDYNPKIKNMPSLFDDEKDIVRIKMPELVKLDPDGMAHKYGYPLEGISGKKDFEIMVDQKALSQRLKGLLPTVDIVGHTFYVDIMMGMLRPKDDFASKGIVFEQIEEYEHSAGGYYTIPYNPQKHEYQEVDNEHIIFVPEDLIAISFPVESILDPVGFNRANNLPETAGLKGTNIRSHFEAKVVEWKDTGIEWVIERNLEKQDCYEQYINILEAKRLKGQKLKQQNLKEQKPSKRQRKGPKL